MQLFSGLFKKKTTPLDMKKYLIVGLGNVGLEYENTRHNVGFQILDRLAEKNELLWETKKLAQHTTVRKKGRQFLLIKPTTFMNRSGKAVRHWALKENIA
jgi:PTH1 family peptidyl-tRNA hydrolase